MSKNFKVIKRTGETVKLDITKIKRQIQWAVDGLELDPMKLEMTAELVFKDNMTTKYIQNSLIDTAIKLASLEEPEWLFVAGRLKLHDMYKEISLTHNPENPKILPYKDFVHLAVSKNLYSEKILEYTDEELEEANSWVGNFIERDSKFQISAINLLYSRYLIKDNDKLFEPPQYMFLTIALLIALIDKQNGEENYLEKAKEYYEAFSNKKLSLATPILMNLRRPNANLSSCFIVDTLDSTEGMLKTIEQVAQISRNGGGVGCYLGKIRAGGSRIKNVKNAASGIIPFTKILNDVILLWNQLGARNGSITPALPIWHADIPEFLTIQTEAGDQRRKAYDVFSQVVLCDAFLEACEKNEEWKMVCPKEVKDKFGYNLPELYGEELKKALKSIDYSKLEIVKTESAKEILKTILKSRVSRGLPYITFGDTLNNKNMNSGTIYCFNLCTESASSWSQEKGTAHTCNLLSLNLATISEEELEYYLRLSVRILDNTIDLTTTPIEESNKHNKELRTLGIGVLGFFDSVAKNQIKWSEVKQYIRKIFSKIAFYTLDESANLAKTRGKYPLFDESKYAKGLCVNGRTYEECYEESPELPWFELKEKILKYGLRNGELTAIAPNTSTSILMSATSGINCPYSLFFSEKTSKGIQVTIPPYAKTHRWYYKEQKNVPVEEMIDFVGEMTKWITQGISLEFLYNLNNKITAKEIYEHILLSWKKGLKSIYYMRSITKRINNEESCVSCAN